MRLRRHFIKTLYIVGSREISLHVVGYVIFFWGPIDKGSFHDSSIFSFVRQTLKMCVSAVHVHCLMALSVSYLTPSDPLALLFGKLSITLKTS